MARTHHPFPPRVGGVLRPGAGPGVLCPGALPRLTSQWISTQPPLLELLHTDQPPFNGSHPDTVLHLVLLGVCSGSALSLPSSWHRFLYSHVSLWWVFGGGTQLTVLGQPKASPTVHLFPPSSEEISSKSKATLVCLMDSFYPGSVLVTWKADGTTMSSGVETTKPSKQSDNKYMSSSYLSLSASDWKSHETYTCQVTHDGKSIEKTLKRSECS
ncbi:immunoglobulin lambda-like polypeptide 5 [Alligator mississippiensis]|uniref:immunoglobulin lambda-like polypeptide 5 n=1 Tax=Alligator mississippiensis TaxID=8496 RepID=UPI00287749A9|nr:immunoglobulin lambda-like polypeptide 5 [Alligator mississippiensis]XP_059569265.1 immunoglobulin lambda-like polypeptide 5 [Alligator mississippiensis]XP_059569266.1 immunoglobulin lambda-like polypeptide 5 [Alligator mississippiensis]